MTISPAAPAALAPALDEAPAGSPPPLGLGIRVAYGFGSLAFGISATVLAGSVLQIYFNQVIGLPAAWVGAAIAITIIVDSITDPLIGRFSDNLRTRWGRRHVLMYASAIPSAFGVWLMWHAPAGLEAAGLLAFMIGMLIFVRVATSFYEIPSYALAPELAPDYHERTALLAWRYMFLVAGAAVMNAILYQVFLREDAANPLGVLNRARYADFGVLAAAVIFVAIITASLATHGRIRHLYVAPERKLTLAETIGELKAIFSHRPLQFLMFTTLLNGFGGGVQFGIQTYLFLHFWALKPQDVGLVLLVAPLSAFLILWAAPTISARVGKKPFMMFCYLAWLTCFVSPPAARFLGLLPVGSAATLPVLVVAGFFALLFALGTHIIFNSLLADAADDVAVRTGFRSEGVLYSAYGLLDKWGAGLGAFGAGLLLSLTHFPAKAAPGSVDMDIMNQLIWVSVPTIAACNIGAMFLVSRFGVDKARHEANQAELQRRRAEAATA